MSVANQKIVVINKPKYTSDFLMIGNDEGVNAYKELKPSTFSIYLYLCSNASGYKYELSQKAIENKLGIKKTQYYDSIRELISKKYMILEKGNKYNFYTTNNREEDNKINREVKKDKEVDVEEETSVAETSKYVHRVKEVFYKPSKFEF